MTAHASIRCPQCGLQVPTDVTTINGNPIGVVTTHQRYSVEWSTPGLSVRCGGSRRYVEVAERATGGER